MRVDTALERRSLHTVPILHCNKSRARRTRKASGCYSASRTPRLQHIPLPFSMASASHEQILRLLKPRLRELQDMTGRNIGVHRAFFEMVESNSAQAIAKKKNVYRCILCITSSSAHFDIGRRVAGYVTACSVSTDGGYSSMKNHVVKQHPEFIPELKAYGDALRSSRGFAVKKTPTAATAAAAASNAMQGAAALTPSERRASAPVLLPGIGGQSARGDLFVPPAERSVRPQTAAMRENMVLAVCKAFMPSRCLDSGYFVRMLGSITMRNSMPSSQHFRSEILPKYRKGLETVVAESMRRGDAFGLSFDLWISSGTGETFAVIAHYIDEDWNRKQQCIGTINVTAYVGNDLVRGLKAILDKHGITERVIGCVTDQGPGNRACTDALRCVEGIGTKTGLYECVGFSHFCSPCVPQLLCAAAAKSYEDGSDCELEMALGEDEVTFADTRKVVAHCIDILRKNTRLPNEAWGGLSGGQGDPLQGRAALPQKEFLPWVRARFTSLYESWKEFGENRDLVNEMMGDKYFEHLPSDAHWVIILSTVKILKPLYDLAVSSKGQWLLSEAVVKLIGIVGSYDALLREVESELEPNLRGGSHPGPQARRDFLRTQRMVFGVSDSHSSVMLALQADVIHHILLDLREALTGLFGYQEQSSHIFVAIALDPRFCRLQPVMLLHMKTHSSGPEQVKAAVSSLCNEYDDGVIISLMLKLGPHSQSRSGNNSNTNGGTDGQGSNAFPSACVDDEMEQFGEGIFGDSGSNRGDAALRRSMVEELEVFRSSVRIPLSASADEVMEWWRDNSRLYPNIAAVWRSLLGIPASTVENERIFGIGGIITLLNRARVDRGCLDDIAYVNHNYRGADEDCRRENVSDRTELLDAEAELTAAGYIAMGQVGVE